MIRFIFLFFLLAFINDSKPKYYNYNIWETKSDNKKLFNEPIEIKEVSYEDMSDSNLNTRFKKNNDYKFDSNGNLIYQKVSQQSDSFWTITKSAITENGLQSFIINHNVFQKKDDTSITRSRILGNGRFLQTNFWSWTVPFYYIESFDDNGNIEKTVAIADTTTFKKIIWTEINYYKNYLIQRHQIIQGDKTSVDTYFYSSENFLDSIYTTSNKKLIGKKVFINNKQGDVEKLLSIRNSGDTMFISTYRYECDKHNNWIKRWKVTNDKRKESLIHFRYSFSEREIKYTQ